MNTKIHPKYSRKKFICSCGAVTETGSAHEAAEIRVNVCSKCHPYYTGNSSKLLDTTGRVEKFKARQQQVKK